MKIRLDRIGDEPYVWQESPAITVEDLAHPDLAEIENARCSGRIVRSSPGFLFQARLTSNQTLRCTRCLRPVSRTTDSRIDLLVVVRGEKTETSGEERDHGEIELGEKDLGVLQLSEPILETEPIVLEQLQIEIPMRILCKEDCEGLCEHCGADLNEGSCDCEKAPDPRWGALAKLKSIDRS